MQSMRKAHGIFVALSQICAVDSKLIAMRRICVQRRGAVVCAPLFRHMCCKKKLTTQVRRERLSFRGAREVSERRMTTEFPACAAMCGVCCS